MLSIEIPRSSTVSIEDVIKLSIEIVISKFKLFSPKTNIWNFDGFAASKLDLNQENTLERSCFKFDVTSAIELAQE